MNRLEYKYLVPLELLPTIRGEIAPFVEVDPYVRNTGQNYYIVHSLYFDTPDLSYYYDKIEGIDIRKKVRLRRYNQLNENSLVFLEIKEKNQKTIRKRRLILSVGENPFLNHQKQLTLIKEQTNSGLNGGHDFPYFMHLIYRDALRPIIKISYKREAFFHRFNRTLRLTFDYHLRSNLQPDINGLFTEQEMVVSIPRHFIWEVKFISGLPSWLLSIIANYQLQQQPLSKYNICLEKHLMQERIKSRIVLSNKNLLKNYFMRG